MNCACDKTDVAALGLGLVILSVGTVTLIGAAGFVFWMLGMH